MSPHAASRRHDEPPTRKPGRPKGSAKWPGSGRRKGTVNRSNAYWRSFIERRSKAVRTICDAAAGKLEVSGLSQAEALKLCWRSIVPELKSQELTGDPEAPITVRDDAEPTSNREIARRLALIFTRGDPLAEADARGGSAVAPAAATAASAFSAAFNGAQAPEGASGGVQAPNDGSGAPAAAEADDKVPEPNQTAFLDYTVRIVNNGPQRPGLPDTFVVTDATGMVIKHFGGDYEKAVQWAREKFNLPDAKVTIATDP